MPARSTYGPARLSRASCAPGSTRNTKRSSLKAALRAKRRTAGVCGRDDPAFACLPDWPQAGLGPLGGLNAALRHAAANGFDAVLSASCDVPNLPDNLRALLSGKGAACAAEQPVVGWWPVAVADELERFLAEGGRALYRFADRTGARQVAFDPPLANVNRPEDLA